MQIGSSDLADYQEACDSLLSTKMQQLNNRSSKKMSSLQHRTENSCRTYTQSSLQSSSFKSQKSPNVRSKKYHKSPLGRNRPKHKNAKEQPENMSNFLRRKGVKLFQIVKGGEEGRKAFMAEIIDIPVTEFTGQAILVLPNGKKYSGEWVEGVLMGTVKITYPNGDVYTGQTYQYQKHGKGELKFSGGRYVGQFSGSDFHGEGILYDREDNIVYDGLWRHGKRYEL